MITGIYKITNKINGHYYIGQAIDIKARFRSHRRSANSDIDKDHNSPIHLAMAKYGTDNFLYEVLEECPREALDEREVYWIDKLKATENGNYNILKGGQDRMKFDDKPVELYDLQGNYIRTVPSATKVAEELGVSRNCIYEVLYGKRPTCKKYQMKYVENEDKVIKPFVSRQGGSIAVNQIDPKTSQIINTFISAAEAGRVIGADSSAITKVCKGKLKTCQGYKWEYANQV